MLGSNKEKEMTKAELQHKIGAWQTLNQVLAQSSNAFMASLKQMLAEKLAEQENLKVKLEKGEGTEKDNAEYLFVSGYVECLKDITSKKAQNEY